LEALVVTDATKKLREPVAYLLLAFVGVYALASILGLFVGDEFTSAARVVQGNLAAPGISGIALLLALAGAVFLVTEFGEPTPNARTVTLAALILVGVLSLILLIAAIAGFANDGDALPKVVGFLYDLGGLALYALVGFLILRTFQAMPAPAKAIGAQGAQAQYGGQQYGGQQVGYDAGQYGGGQYGGQPYAGQQGQYDAQGQYTGQYGDAGQGQYAGQYGGYAAQQGPEHTGAEQSAWSYGTEGAAEAASHEAGQQWGSSQQWGQQADAGDQWSQGGDTQQWPPASESSSQWGQDAQWPSDAGEQQWGQHQGWGQQSQQPQSWEQPAESGAEAPDWRSPESASADAGHAAADTHDANPALSSAEARDEEEDDGSSGSAKKDDQQGWWSQPPQ
jgi:hypothetical protein